MILYISGLAKDHSFPTSSVLTMAQLITFTVQSSSERLVLCPRLHSW